jgi:hypothetical protein
MGPAPAGLLQVGDISPDAVRSGVKEIGVEIRKPKATTQEGGEQGKGT